MVRNCGRRRIRDLRRGGSRPMRVSNPPADVIVPRDLFGDGSDGDVTIAGDTTLSRDMYDDNLTVDVGADLNTAGWRVFVRNVCTVNGSISCDGVAATDAVADGRGGSGFCRNGARQDSGNDGSGGPDGGVGAGAQAGAPL